MRQILLRTIGALAALLLAPVLQASVVITVVESGGDVVMSSPGGTLDLTGANLDWDNFGPLGGFVQPTSPELFIGPSQLIDVYDVFDNPGSIGSGFNPTNADATTGTDTYGVSGTAIFVPDDYVSGALLSASSATFVGKSFVSLKLNEGSYVWDLPSSDTLTVNVTSVVPIPAAAWLFGSGLLGMIGIAIRKKAA
jgi:hypothetical protein